jgi:DNA-binding NarL/FixJ family response regulator
MRICILHDPGRDDLPAPVARPGLRVVAWLPRDGDCDAALARLQPDLIVVDLRDAPLLADAVLSRIARQCLRARVLLLGDGTREVLLQQLAQHGLQGAAGVDPSRVGLMRLIDACERPARSDAVVSERRVRIELARERS